MKGLFSIMVLGLAGVASAQGLPSSSGHVILANGNIICWGPYYDLDYNQIGIAVVKYNAVHDYLGGYYLHGDGYFSAADLIVKNNDIYFAGTYTDRLDITMMPSDTPYPTQEIFANGEDNVFVIKFDDGFFPEFVLDLDAPEDLFAHDLVDVQTSLRLVHSAVGEAELLSLPTKKPGTEETYISYTSTGLQLTMKVIPTNWPGDPGGVRPESQTIPSPPPSNP